MSKRPNLLQVLLGALLIVVLACLIFLFRDSDITNINSARQLEQGLIAKDPDGDKEWSLFRSDRYGFALAYPSDWFSRPTKNGVIISDDKVFVEDGLLSPGAYPENWVSIVAYRTNKTLEEYYAQDVLDKTDVLVIDRKGMVVSGLDALRIKASYKSPSGTQYIYLATYIQREGDILIASSAVNENVLTPYIEKTVNAVIDSIKVSASYYPSTD